MVLLFYPHGLSLQPIISFPDVLRSPGSSVGNDLAVSGSSPALGEGILNRKRGFFAHNLSFLPTHRPDMSKMLLMRT